MADCRSRFKGCPHDSALLRCMYFRQSSISPTAGGQWDTGNEPFSSQPEPVIMLSFSVCITTGR